MSIQEWAALAEIIGAVAVVVALIYLAVQIRQNTHELSMSLRSTELAAMVQQRVHLFEETAEKASGAE